MAKRIDLYGKEDVRVALPNLTVAEVEDILAHIPENSRYRVRLEAAIKVDVELGYWPRESLAMFVMADFAESYDRYGSGDLADAVAQVDASDLSDVLCSWDWDIALANGLRDDA